MGIEELPSRLVELREARGLDRKGLCKQMNMPYSTMSNYENGSREPGHDFIVALANFYGITTDEILLGEKQKAPSDIPKEQNEKSQLKAAGLIPNDYELTETDKRFLKSIEAQIRTWFSDG